MKKLLSFLLVALMMLCLFTGCGDNRNYKEEVFTALSQKENAIAFSGVLEGAVTTGSGEAKAINMTCDVAIKDFEVSAYINFDFADDFQTLIVYSDGKSFYISDGYTSVKFGFNDIKQYFSDYSLDFDSADIESLIQFVDGMEKLVNKEEIDGSYNSLIDSYKAAVVECTAEEDDDESVYTLKFDSENLNSSVKNITTDYISEFIGILAFASTDYFYDLDMTDVDEAKTEIKDVITKSTTDFKKMTVTLEDGEVKKVKSTFSSETTADSEAIEIKMKSTLEVTNRGDKVVVDNSITEDATDFAALMDEAIDSVNDDYYDDYYDYSEPVVPETEDIVMSYVEGAKDLENCKFGEYGFFGPYPDMDSDTGKPIVADFNFYQLDPENGLIFNVEPEDSWVTSEVSPQEIGHYKYAIIEAKTDDPSGVDGFTITFGSHWQKWEDWIDADGNTLPSLTTDFQLYKIDLDASGVEEIVDIGVDFALNQGAAKTGNVYIKSITFTNK